MELEVKKASSSDKYIIQNLFQLYEHDSSEFDGYDVNSHGLFDFHFLDLYWIDETRFPFLFFVDHQIAGFALVNKRTSTGADYNLADFFVLRKYRKMGVGKQVAYSLFDQFSGSWEIPQTKSNVPAQNFWEKIVSLYTSHGMKKYKNEEENIICFHSENKTK